MKKVALIGLLQVLFIDVLYSQWIQLPFPVTSDLGGVAFCNADTGFVVTNNTVYRTTDGGGSWLLSTTSPYALFDVCVPKFGRNSGVIYAVGGLLSFSFNPQTQDVRSVILKTTNYGESWITTVDASGIGASRLEYCYFVNESIGFVMGSCGPYINNNSFKKTTDGGQTWAAVTGFAVSVYSGNNMDFVTETLAYMNGNLGGVLKTTNQGNNWVNLGGALNTLRVSFLNDSVGYKGAVGIYKTTNSGLNWTTIDTVFYGQDMDFSDIETGHIVADTGRVFKTINGQKFLKQSSPTTNAVYKINLLNRDTLYVIGSAGTVLKTTNGGGHLSTSETQQFASEFRLEQNYPNPFNPTTTIKFSIAQTSLVSLAVYDVLGREVQTLINERKPSGNYTVSFNASQLSSGIYFYRLVTSSFSQTRKMILIK